MLHRAPSRAQRANKRVIGASVVSVGLVLSAALYPLPGDSRLLDLFPPEGGASPLRSPGSSLVQLQLTDRDMFDAITASALPEVIRELLNGGPTMVPGFDDLSVATLNALVETYGLPNLVLALNTLARIAPLVAGGGHGWSGPPIDVGQGVLPTLVILLDFLQQELPALFVAGSPALVVMVMPAVLRSLGILAAPAPPPPGPTVSTFAGPPVADPGPNLEPAPSHDPVPPPEPTPVSAPTYAPQVAVQDQVFTPTPEPLPEVPAVVTVLSTTDPAPELPLETREPLQPGGIDGDPVEEPSDPDPPATAEPDDTATAEPDPPQQTQQNEPEENKPDDNPPGGTDENGA